MNEWLLPSKILSIFRFVCVSYCGVVCYFVLSTQCLYRYPSCVTAGLFSNELPFHQNKIEK